MANTTWTQSAGMVSDEETDNLESYSEQAEASKDAAAVSAAAAEAAKVAAAASEAAALASKNSAATSATTATTGAATATTKASEAAASAASASTSATDAQTAQTAAEAAETAAAASEAAVAASAAAASTSETNAASSASAASTSETNAATSETNAASSATASASSATASAASASAASASETAAAASETAAAASETAAATSETNASASETAAAASEAAAGSSASSASTSATNAASSASAASTSETNAAASEAAAATSEANAATSEANAATSASASATSATASAGSATASASSASAASASETAAATSEGNAATSASNAATSATNAATSETNASTSATAAASSASSASASADAALAALDSFDDRYLGQKASDPTLDNDGNALIAGALYFNTTDDIMNVYEGSVWVAAYASLSGALLATNNLSDVLNAATARTNLGLGTAATTASTDYATAAQGSLADSALQSGDNVSALTNDAGYTTNVGDITGVTAGSGITGGGTSGTVTINHADTSSQGSVDNSGATVIQDVTVDTYGHVTGLGSKTLTAADVGAITGNQTITLSGDVSGSGTTSISVTVADDSHNHIIANVDGLQTALDGKLSTSGKAADSNLLDGLDLHTGRNNEANRVVRTQSNGYAEFGWINTTSGDTGSSLSRVYVDTGDGYIRKCTLAHLASQGGFAGDITGVTAGSGITGGGTSGTVTISHADTSSQGSVDNSGTTFIQDITLDTYGHITAIGSATVSTTPPTTYDAVGTYGFFRHTGNNTTVNAGSTYSGSILRAAGATTGFSNAGTTLKTGTNGSAPSGTWRAMGTHDPNGDYALTVYVRIS